MTKFIKLFSSIIKSFSKKEIAENSSVFVEEYDESWLGI